MGPPPLPQLDAARTSYFPPPSKERPAPVVYPGASSDDSISSVASSTSSSSTSTVACMQLPPPHPYSALVYTPPTRNKDDFIDDEELLGKWFLGLGLAPGEEGLGGVSVDRSAGGVSPEESGVLSLGSATAPPLYPIPRSPATRFSGTPSLGGPPRHTSLPAIVTSANAAIGLDMPSPIASPFSSSVNANSITGSALSVTPDVSPGQSPVLPPFPQPGTSASTITSTARTYPPTPAFCPSSSRSPTSISSRTSLSHSSAYASAASMCRSGSSASAPAGPASAAPCPASLPPWQTRLPSPTTSSARPGSAGTSSTTASSTRPWVFDSDASSVCSANSSGWSSGNGGGAPVKSGSAAATAMGAGAPRRERRVTEDGEEYEVDEGGEVFKAQGDVEFLDHRPEPPGAKLSINRDDPSTVVLKVTLPGFSLDNITVAMRRGHKIHIVADSYGENGGHFEKLIHLGSDVSSMAPRAEFNGTDLNVYIQRRPSRPSSSTSSSGAGAPAFDPAGLLSSPGSTLSSPASSALDHRRPSIASSLASVWSDASSTTASNPVAAVIAPYPLSPSLEYPSAFPAQNVVEEELPPPCTVKAGSLDPLDSERKKKSRSLTGPEGAKAAAKAAREEAASRAKEEAKKLPSTAKGGRRLPFRRTKEGSDGSKDGGRASSPKNRTVDLRPPDGGGGAPVERNGTIKASSASSRSISPLPMASSSSSSAASFSSAATSPSTSPASPHYHKSRTLPPATMALHSSSSFPSILPNLSGRPKLRAENLTIRPLDGGSFTKEAERWAAAGEDEGDRVSDGGSSTPREEQGMRFTPVA
ncbi:hypothetical protein JCM5296_000048 [Sporobolomyces johnsonii]